MRASPSVARGRRRRMNELEKGIHIGRRINSFGVLIIDAAGLATYISTER